MPIIAPANGFRADIWVGRVVIFIYRGVLALVANTSISSSRGACSAMLYSIRISASGGK